MLTIANRRRLRPALDGLPIRIMPTVYQAPTVEVGSPTPPTDGCTSTTDMTPTPDCPIYTGPMSVNYPPTIMN